MKRKIIVWQMVVFLLAAVSLAEAQQGAKISRVGFLGSVPAPWMDAFKQGLRELGWIEGKSIIIEYRPDEGQVDRLSELAAELVRLKVDVIVGTTTDQALAAQKATNTIPIVFAGTSDPVGSGLVTSLARPGGNVTGIRFLSAELGGKRLDILKETIPKLSQVAVLWRPLGAGQKPQMEEIETAARALQVQLQPMGVQGPKDLENEFSTLKRKPAGALIVLSSPWFSTYRARITELAASHRLPAIYAGNEFADAGGLMSYGANRFEQYRRAATYVDKILKGAKPADLPVEQPKKFEFIVNLKAAKQIGLTIPPNVLARADKVIR
jgi:putative ABC transport system substrate-binding protein